MSQDSEISTEVLALTADIISSHVSNNTVATADLPHLIASVHAALLATTKPAASEAPVQEPAVPIRSSIKHDYIVCLEDGKKLKMLKRYLRTNYNMTPEEYRTKWNLPRDYTMVAPAYAEQRRDLAKSIGLGRKPAGAPATIKAAAAPKATKAKTAATTPKAPRKMAKAPGAKSPETAEA